MLCIYINLFIRRVPAMNHYEIATPVKREYNKIYKTTLRRLGAEYDRESRKLRINKGDLYPKEYEIKTPGKNNWIIFLHKAPGVKKYTGTEATLVYAWYIIIVIRGSGPFTRHRTRYLQALLRTFLKDIMSALV